MFKRAGQSLPVVTILLSMCAVAKAGNERVIYASVREIALAPIGWIEFCVKNPAECSGRPSRPRDIVMSQTAWRDLLRVNRWVNETITPVSDIDHWGVSDRWSLPTDGYGDCEDYVLLKRKILIDAGWPREALLITVVSDNKGEGHAVLTVKSNKGEFILDNKNENLLAWTETGYRFIKRQSQSDPNVWVSLGDSPAAASTASLAQVTINVSEWQPSYADRAGNGSRRRSGNRQKTSMGLARDRK
jgi:predicted transglutaminase-like cysteine proteinase